MKPEASRPVFRAPQRDSLETGKIPLDVLIDLGNEGDGRRPPAERILGQSLQHLLYLVDGPPIGGRVGEEPLMIGVRPVGVLGLVEFPGGEARLQRRLVEDEVVLDAPARFRDVLADLDAAGLRVSWLRVGIEDLDRRADIQAGRVDVVPLGILPVVRRAHPTAPRQNLAHRRVDGRRDAPRGDEDHRGPDDLCLIWIGALTALFHGSLRDRTWRG